MTSSAAHLPSEPRSSVPRTGGLDASLSLWRDGYDFIWKRCRRLQTELFETRLLGRRAVCIHGAEAIDVFYDAAKLQRTGALPRRVVTSLFGKHAVHTLDGEAHRQRKRAFLSLMGSASLERSNEAMSVAWRLAIRRWDSAPRVELFSEAQRLLARASCDWAGVSLPEQDVGERARDLGAMIDAFGGVGPRLWRGKLARLRTEGWIQRVIDRERRAPSAPAGSALQVMAAWLDERGQPLPLQTAAVELINVIRPTVAIAWYVAFAALALERNPALRDRIAREPPDAAGAGAFADCVMQEVRRFYPFTPYLGARVCAPFAWKGYDFEPGTLVLLDVYGTNHDPALWQAPDEFVPERFAELGTQASRWLIPQGGGDPATGHRCPGEWLTMHALALALHFLTRGMSYEVAPQGLGFGLQRMPTRPQSGLILRNVRALPALDEPAPRAPSPTAAAEVAAFERRGGDRCHGGAKSAAPAPRPAPKPS
jgi:fatty-acid peroxygenase